jgi:hypothetical protein
MMAAVGAVAAVLFFLRSVVTADLAAGLRDE